MQKNKHDAALIRLALHRSNFFTCLDEEQIQRFIESAVLMKYNPGDVLISRGALTDDDEGALAIYIVRSGTVGVYVYGDERHGNEVQALHSPQYMAGRGDMFGEGTRYYVRAHSHTCMQNCSRYSIIENLILFLTFAMFIIS